ncbi:flagellar protein [Ruminococcaceae bacterium OttesenSCG-928-I18]|nr:flagellar protein [Ruminococcaceae bacterium OttesenSCG-928-I18]
MDQINRLTRPIVTGTPAVAPQAGTPATQSPQEGANSFLNVLQRQLEEGSNIAFSKHAVSRVHERQIDVSSQNLERLDEGMKLAQEKGLREALILIDENAYIVNAANGKVITVDGEANKGSVFTNIDGTVII